MRRARRPAAGAPTREDVGYAHVVQAVGEPNIVTGTRGEDTWMGFGYEHQFEVDIDDVGGEIERGASFGARANFREVAGREGAPRA